MVRLISQEVDCELQEKQILRRDKAMVNPWSKLGFWPLGETGIYLLGVAQRIR